MKYIEKIFFGLNGREQTLLTLALWSVLVIFLFVVSSSVGLFDQWQLNEQVISGHKKYLILSLQLMEHLSNRERATE